MRREYLYDRENLPGSAGSRWLSSREHTALPSLAGDVAVDVAVLGGGMTGILTALRMAEDGARVALIEGRRFCSDVSGHTTAKATAQHGLITANVPQDSRQPWLEENVRALDRLEKRAASAGEAAGFSRLDSVLYTTKADGVDALHRELNLYRSLELGSEMVAEEALPEGVYGGVRLDAQGLIDPVGLCDALLAHPPQALLCFEQSMVRAIDEERDGVTLVTDGGRVKADAIVVATHVPFFDTLLYSTRLFQEMTYALEIELASDPPQGMWYTEDSPSLSWRPAAPGESRRLIVSGVSHKSGQGADEREHYRKLAEACDARFGGVEVLRHWSTQDPKTADGLPLMGKMFGRDRCYVASGYNGWGMTSAEVAADLLGTLIGGGEHALTHVVSPQRLEATGLVTLAIENADFVAKAFTAEVVADGEYAELAPGEGKPMRVSGKHVAAMRDADGTLHSSDAHCAHMRCGVQFNEAEGTWDCPCHGSRFYGDGEWLHGPAKRGLEHVDVEEA